MHIYEDGFEKGQGRN